MQRRYKIVGVIEEPVLVRLVLQAEDLIKIMPPKVDLVNAAGAIAKGGMGIAQLIEQTTKSVQYQLQAKLGRDTVCISYEDHRQHNFKNGDIITIDINIEK